MAAEVGQVSRRSDSYRRQGRAATYIRIEVEEVDRVLGSELD